ncbi:TetR/AcrR family transcriptional regulator [Candidatus Formimonas warabiya]|uniref:TetR/AcrR family transcriptional regulator n=1 Tax=Formimonas warabiya TaxID=1761012 RepID=UPI001F4867F1|nr:TetR/AcrR family transcriptional regulator [Candidatus Formimonas warabiya]
MTQKNSYHHDDLKSELIAKGLKLLDEEGYEGFSLRKVAKACHVSHTAPYRHYKNKDDLIMAIAFETMDKFNRSLQEAVDQYPDDPKSQLKEMGCAYIKFFAENPEYFRLIFLSDINKKINHYQANPDQGHYFTDQYSSGHPFGTLYRAVERYLGERQSAGNCTMDQDALTLYCWGLVHGISILIARKEFSYQGDYLALTRRILWNHEFLD